MSDQYNVFFRGELLDGFELEAVQNAFAKTFKINSEKAKIFFNGKKHTLRKNIDHKKAYQFKEVLAGLGASVELRRIAPQPSSPVQELSLEPIAKNNPEESTEGEVSAPSHSVNVKNSQFFCPKCGAKQTKKIECIDCGIIFDKFLARQSGVTVNDSINISNHSSTSSVNQSMEKIVAEDTGVSEGSSFNTTALLASIITAIVGAFLWKFIAVAFDYELGLIAWGIGGGIGFAAATFGSRGSSAGIICGVLALLSILGGKYMAYEIFQSEFANNLSSYSEELKEVYEKEKLIAELYTTQVNSEQSRKQFMVDYGYTDSILPQQISDDELNDFNNYSAPRLEKLFISSIDYETWLENGFQESITAYSTIELMKESFGLLDILFLFFGIGTAFRLASNE